MRFVASSLVTLGLCTLPFTVAAHAAKPPLAPPPAPPLERTLAAPTPAALDHVERAALRAATAARRDLGSRRAGDLDLRISDHDLRVIVIAVVVTLLIVVLT